MKDARHLTHRDAPTSSVAPVPATDDEPNLVLTVRGLRCHLGKKKTRAEILRGVDLDIPRGGILAVLGANGAGKTTLVNVLSTLLPASDGTVIVDGHNLADEPAGVRSAIALTGQYAAVDEELTGQENLVYFGRLAGLRARDAGARADALLERFDLVAAGGRLVSEYSGGMRRRLDIAASLTVPPALLFLDEPTTGLDPAARNSVWDTVRNLAADGTSILLTTQYLDEADQLADRVAVLAGGRVLDEGTPGELKERYGTTVCLITMASPEDAERLEAMAGEHGMAARREGVAVGVDAPDGHRTLVRALELWDGEDDAITDVSLVPPTLDDVYFAIAGSGDIAAAGGNSPADAGGSR
ncbi:ATP-binding cassette domain-containing protein [Corynebacterium uberis]|uniref:ATP-binding cassette domain-containing protein n=1 Tax=Corynebacterium uberis TaxID=2883169 RepID=UPI001D0BA3ED|nr:ATP-binding cassette domain-containing protein [Corynebacterium uberis]UDL80453.1 ATP-binding cassette domain-containing protein [Corynebacterium uberis]